MCVYTYIYIVWSGFSRACWNQFGSDQLLLYCIFILAWHHFGRPAACFIKDHTKQRRCGADRCSAERPKYVARRSCCNAFALTGTRNFSVWRHEFLLRLSPDWCSRWSARTRWNCLLHTTHLAFCGKKWACCVCFAKPLLAGHTWMILDVDFPVGNLGVFTGTTVGTTLYESWFKWCFLMFHDVSWTLSSNII